MPFFIYILYSASLDNFYVGQTEDLQDRLFRHNNSRSKSTKKTNDWKLAYTETFDSRNEAYRREPEIKKKKSKKYIGWLIQQTA